MDDTTPRGRRRLRQRYALQHLSIATHQMRDSRTADGANAGVATRPRSDRATPQRDVPEHEIIALDSSSDVFEPSSDSQSDASDAETVQHGKTARAASKRRGLKRLRQSNTGATSRSSSGDDSVSPAKATAALDASTHQLSEWECTRCTYLNEPQRVACEICLTARATPKPTRHLSAWLTSTAAAKPRSKTRGAHGVTGSASASTSTPALELIDSSDDSDQSAAHPPRRHRSPPLNKPSLDTDSDLLWAESSHAQQIDELCVQKKKVQEVQAWLQQSVPSSEAAPRPLHHATKRLLFLCGPPGTGKSTTVRHLTKAMGVTIKEWRDNTSAGKLQYQRYLRDEFQTTQVTAWDDFIDFLNRSVNYSALQVAAVPEKRSRKRALTQLPLGETTTSPSQAQLILLENWPQNPLGSSQDATVWDEKLTAAFRQVVNPAANLQYPVVCIFSDVRDKKVDANQLAKVFSEDVVRSPFTSIINFNPVTTAQMKKTLLRTIEKMGCSISSHDLMKIIDRSDGDIRHAMNMAQLVHKRRALAQTKREKPQRKKSASTLNGSARLDEADDEERRDSFLSDFRVVGKLLHCKNINLDTSEANAVGSTESRLSTFDRVLDTSAMSLDRVLSLLHSNCTEYFTEVEDLGDALDLMSQSETWLHDSYRTSSSSAAFKTSHDVVRSVLVRSIALTNKNPAPSAFRPITAPKTYETTRRMVSSRQESLFQQQEMTGGSASSHPYLCRGDVYAFEIQPFVDAMRLHHHTHQRTGLPDRNAACTGASDPILDDEIENSDGDGW